MVEFFNLPSEQPPLREAEKAIADQRDLLRPVLTNLYDAALGVNKLISDDVKKIENKLFRCIKKRLNHQRDLIGQVINSLVSLAQSRISEQGVLIRLISNPNIQKLLSGGSFNVQSIVTRTTQATEGVEPGQSPSQITQDEGIPPPSFASVQPVQFPGTAIVQPTVQPIFPPSGTDNTVIDQIFTLIQNLQAIITNHSSQIQNLSSVINNISTVVNNITQAMGPAIVDGISTGEVPLPSSPVAGGSDKPQPPLVAPTPLHTEDEGCIDVADNAALQTFVSDIDFGPIKPKADKSIAIVSLPLGGAKGDCASPDSAWGQMLIRELESTIYTVGEFRVIMQSRDPFALLFPKITVLQPE